MSTDTEGDFSSIDSRHHLMRGNFDSADSDRQNSRREGYPTG